jgi:hypothetical protein
VVVLFDAPPTLKEMYPINRSLGPYDGAKVFRDVDQQYGAGVKKVLQAKEKEVI